MPEFATGCWLFAYFLHPSQDIFSNVKLKNADKDKIKGKRHKIKLIID